MQLNAFNEGALIFGERMKEMEERVDTLDATNSMLDRQLTVDESPEFRESKMIYQK